MTSETNIIFREVQQFRQFWLWLILIFISLPLVFVTLTNNLSLSGAFVILLNLGLLALFYSMKLITEVRSDGLYVRFFPLHLSFHKIPLEELKKYEARSYSPIREYGGWGIRYGFKGKAYNVSGNRGVQLEFLNGKRLLIGSQKPEELVQAIELAFPQAK